MKAVQIEPFRQLLIADIRGKRRVFDPLEVNFVRYLKCLIRGGARSD